MAGSPLSVDDVRAIGGESPDVMDWKRVSEEKEKRVGADGADVSRGPSPEAADCSPRVGQKRTRAASDTSSDHDSDLEEGMDEGGGGMNQEDKAARCRERNREHARRTRMRKKAQLQRLQTRVAELKAEAERLVQALQECSIANILMNIAGAPTGSDHKSSGFVLQQLALTSPNVSLEPPEPPPLAAIKAPQINWKNGYSVDAQGRRRALSASEMEGLRRERNRMHAKMTRDRKKILVQHLEQTIVDLEAINLRRREALEVTLRENLTHDSLVRFASRFGLFDAHSDWTKSQ